MNPSLTRRRFIGKSLAGAGLTLVVFMTPQGLRIAKAEEMPQDPPGVFSPVVWIKVKPDNTVIIVINKSEMGQGIYTALPMIAADEMDADWKQVQVEEAPAGRQYIDPVWGMQATGGSTSIRHMHEPMRQAGALVREMLLRAAAEEWGVSRNECEAAAGTVRGKKGGKSFTYGQLSAKAAKLPIPENPPLKKAGQFNFVGQPLARLDIPSKVHGTAVFGIDASAPDLLYASIARPPVYGAKAEAFDGKAAEKVPGVYKVVAMESGVAVCARTLTAAWEGKKALKVQWSKGSDPNLDNKTLEDRFLQDLEKKGLVARSEGDAPKALAQAAKKVEATYLLPYLAHETMEPMNGTAYVQKDRCDVWVPTQNQSGTLQAAMKITGLKADQIHVHTTFLGGGFGRRSDVDYAVQALLASRETGKPVKVVWTRDEDTQNDFYRPGNSCRIEGGLDAKGNLVAYSHKVVCPSLFARVFPQRVKGGIDPAAVEGIADPYEIPNVLVEYVRIDTPIPVGFWRSVGSSENAFTVESFMDELAHEAQRDPLEFRLTLLKNNPRVRRLLEELADKSGWGKPPRRGQAVGMAYHFSFGTHVAQVAEISVDKQKGTIKVHRVVCVVDCGPVINPAIITAQMNSGIIMGLSAALKERIDFAKGGVASGNFDSYPILRMREAPEEIDVHIIQSEEKFGGIGEPGLPPIAPAMANALFRATGARMRKLPLTPEAVKEALKK